MSAPGGKITPHVAALTADEARALDLRIAGATYQQIADALQCARSTAYETVCRALERSDAAMAEKAQAHRELEAQRLDALLRAAWADATTVGADSQHAAMDRVLKIMERRAKLLGLDVPTRTEVTGKDGDPLIPAVDPTTLVEKVRAIAARRRAERVAGGTGGDPGGAGAGGA